MNGELFGARVRLLREGRGLTQARLARMAGVASDTISRVESARFSPSLDTMIKIADGLKLPLEALLGEKFDQADELAALIRGLPERDRQLAATLVGAMYGTAVSSQPQG
ncbi:DNA-binding protein [Plesiocystis pacifica SIR-1]|uniref:DNA-binding protein n=1 Tax=Plesiocystis pacifica SIR-1 TaxID=391625 RepID=A6GBR8_9BACT|nr:helix-turn-helix transcriptional regulator [Plesiocystis pacifica]EDM76685.1 DNA-binding protein [Plesiocystis pacifica SIR-1]